MILYHLSHNDLDGFGCHLITNEFFKEKFLFNANYGQEVTQSIARMLELIEQSNEKNEILFLITDLNLPHKEAKDLDKKIKNLNKNGFNIILQLLDHHITGQKSADSLDWYFLDINRCATKITYDYFCEKSEEFKETNKHWLSPIVDAINAVDIWLENEKENFEFGKVLMSMVTRANEINSTLFSEENREYRIWLLKKAKEYISLENGNIKLDCDIHKLKKEFLSEQKEDDTLDNLSAQHLVHLLEHKKDELTVDYKGHKGLLTYSLGSISIPANAFLKANKDFDFFIDVSKRGTASLRADGNLDVSKLAANLAPGGGGHKNASGTKFVDFVETINYSDIKVYIQTKLNNLK